MSNAAETQHRFQSSDLLWLVFFLIAFGTVLFGIVLFGQMGDHHDLARSRYVFEQQLAALKAGQSNSVWLYDARGADALLSQLAGMPEVVELSVDSTDASDTGFAAVATLPNLRTLSVNRTGLTDQALAQFKSAPLLESLSLKNTHVTGEGLRSLQHFPKLRELSIQFEHAGRLTPSDDTIKGLAELSQLKSLHLGGATGDWTIIDAVEMLRTKLPGCSITTDLTPRDKK